MWTGYVGVRDIEVLEILQLRSFLQSHKIPKHVGVGEIEVFQLGVALQHSNVTNSLRVVQVQPLQISELLEAPAQAAIDIWAV